MKLFGFAGWSGAGKTTLIERLIPVFTGAGLAVSLIKEANDAFDVDQPGKDSWRHRKAGCGEVMVVSGRRWAIMHELRREPREERPSLEDCIARMSPCDLLLVEGYRSYAAPKIEVHRAGLDRAFIHPGDPHIVALATDVAVDTPLPIFHPDDIEGIATFIRAFPGYIRNVFARVA